MMELFRLHDAICTLHQSIVHQSGTVDSQLGNRRKVLRDRALYVFFQDLLRFDETHIKVAAAYQDTGFVTSVAVQMTLHKSMSGATQGLCNFDARVQE
jgi:hypothetical protein